MTGILVAGTSSDAGKSLVVTALCRVARRRGVDVVPFKAQNMSNNSMVCADGSEIGRAQYLQATAAGVTPTSAMNPVLLKPGTDRRSFVVLRGKPGGVLEAGEYTTGRRYLAEAAWAAYDELAASHDMVICEGAGSPAEINLRRGDYTNMGLARAKNLPVVLVGDIDRGGVLASLFGTWALLDDDDRALLAGYIVNKFRGDDAILAPGLEEITDRTGMPSFGVLPWVPGVWLDGEDALDVQVTTNPDTCQAADVLVLPGSRSTVSDLEWLRRSGIADVVARRAEQGRTVVGICGGYQMLCRTILDPDGQETTPGSVVEGLGLLPVEVDFAATKTLALSHGTWRGIEVGGYEIHHGVCRSLEDAEAFLDGVHVGPVWGTMWHGAFEHDEFRRTWLADAARHAGSSWRPHSDELGYQARREAMIETLADALEAHVDVDRILHLVR